MRGDEIDANVHVAQYSASRDNSPGEGNKTEHELTLLVQIRLGGRSTAVERLRSRMIYDKGCK